MAVDLLPFIEKLIQSIGNQKSIATTCIQYRKSLLNTEISNVHEVILEQIDAINKKRRNETKPSIQRTKYGLWKFKEDLKKNKSLG